MSRLSIEAHTFVATLEEFTMMFEDILQKMLRFLFYEVSVMGFEVNEAEHVKKVPDDRHGRVKVIWEIYLCHMVEVF